MLKDLKDQKGHKVIVHKDVMVTGKVVEIVLNVLKVKDQSLRSRRGKKVINQLSSNSLNLTVNNLSQKTQNSLKEYNNLVLQFAGLFFCVFRGFCEQKHFYELHRSQYTNRR